MFVAKLLILGILFSISVILTTSFVTTLLKLLASSGRGFNLSMSNLLTSILKLAKFVLMQNLKYQYVKYF